MSSEVWSMAGEAGWSDEEVNKHLQALVRKATKWSDIDIREGPDRLRKISPETVAIVCASPLIPKSEVLLFIKRINDAKNAQPETSGLRVAGWR